MLNRVRIKYAKIQIVIWAAIGGIILFIPVSIMSCPIPVFRYALEYWETDPYSLEIFYENSLTPEEEVLENYLLGASSDSKIKANLEVIKTDANGDLENITRSHLHDHTSTGSPLMVLRYPLISGNKRVIWSGPLNKSTVDHLLYSPVRGNIGQKLAKDATAVWILLESGDKKKDNAAMDMLEKELQRLEQTLVLPDRQLWLDLNEELPVIKFEIVRMSRNDQHEEQLVKMLLNSEDDLKEFESEPIVFPVYGRGIVLYGIVGKGINEWNIREAAEFITGPCSCQAKLLNPGVDLLISMNWDKLVKNLTDISIANPLSGMGNFINREEEASRLLESATMRRFGTGINKNNENKDLESEKLVYLNIFGNNTQVTQKEKIYEDPEQFTEQESATELAENKVSMAEPVNNNQMPEEEKEEVRRAFLNDETAEKESPGVLIGNKQERKGFKTLALIFGGVVLTIFLSGIIFYLKASKN